MICGCGFHPYWSESQYKVIVERLCKSKDYKFHGWSGEFCGASTKLILEDIYGVWNSTSIQKLKVGRGSPYAKAEKYRGMKRNNPLKDDSIFIEEFMESGRFVEGTTFVRSSKESSRGNKIYWIATCGKCNTSVETVAYSLKQGHFHCLCSDDNKPKSSYIHLVKYGNFCCIKFGIAKSINHRMRRLKAENPLIEITNLSGFKFESGLQTAAAELECKAAISCGLLTKEEMPDGYTETACILYKDYIEDIFIKYGGNKIW